MDRFPGLRRLFRLVGRRAPIEQEIDAELEFHFAAEVERQLTRGMSQDQAREAAARQFGDVRSARSELVRIDRGLRERSVG